MGRGCQQRSCPDTHLEIHRSVDWCKHIYFIFLYKIKEIKKKKNDMFFFCIKTSTATGQTIKKTYILKSVTITSSN